MMPEPIWLLVDVLAAYRLTRLITRDAWPPVKAARDWLLRRWPSADAEYSLAEIEPADGEPLDLGEGRLSSGVRVFLVDGGRWLAVEPHWLGELITCPWCMGQWVSLVMAALTPGITYPVAWIAVSLGLSTAVGLLSRMDA
jgi:hypothetical protein